MDREGWKTLVNLFRWRYRDNFLTEEDEEGKWFNLAMLYPDAVVDHTVRYYVEACDTEPTYNTFRVALDEIKSGKIESFFKARSDANVKCRRCNDYGYVCMIYPTKTEYVRPCNCQTAIEKFAWMDDDRHMSEIDCMAKFGIERRFLDEQRIKYIRRPRVIGNMKPSGKKGSYSATSLAERMVIYDVIYE